MKQIEPDPQEVYPLQVVVRMTGAPRRKIVFYCRKGVVAPVRPAEEHSWHFDQEAVARLRLIEELRRRHRMNWAAIRMIVGLMREVETLRDELRFRR